MQDFSFTVQATDGAARKGEIHMPRGVILTPAFMPVGTAATVKAMYTDQVWALGADVVLGNTYHLMLRPGAERRLRSTAPPSLAGRQRHWQPRRRRRRRRLGHDHERQRDLPRGQGQAHPHEAGVERRASGP